MTEVIRSYINDGIGLVQLAATLVAITVVLATWAKTKSAIATISMIAVAVLVVGYVHNADWFGQKAAEDIKTRDNGMAPAALTVDHPGTLAG